MNKYLSFSIAAATGVVATLTAPAAFQGASVLLQPSTPGTQQVGHSNISGTAIAGTFKGTAATLSGTVTATTFKATNITPTGITYAADFRNSSTSGRAIHAWATATTGGTYAGLFQNSSTTGRAVTGLALATSGLNYGIFGRTSSPDGYAGYFDGRTHVNGTLSATLFSGNGSGLTGITLSGVAGGDLTGTYPNPSVAAGAITSGKLANAAVTNLKIAIAAVTSSALADGAVITAKMADGTVTDAKVASVGWGKIVGAPTSYPPGGAAGGSLSGTYPNPSIAGGAIGTGQIADGAVTTAKLADGSVSTAKIVDSAITGAKIAANSVTNAKIVDVAWAKIIGAPASFPPSGAAGRDLGGTYPNPLVVGIQDRPVLSTAPLVNQVLKWDGSAWKPDTDETGPGGPPKVDLQGSSPGTPQVGHTNLTGTVIAGQFQGGGAGLTGIPWAALTGTPPDLGGDVNGPFGNNIVERLQGRVVSSTQPSPGQVLAWNNIIGKWEPTDGGLVLPYTGSGNVAPYLFQLTNNSTSNPAEAMRLFSQRRALYAQTSGAFQALEGNGSGYGVVGVANATSGRAVYGEASGSAGIGIYGYAPDTANGYAVWGQGRLNATIKQFMIDHPFDPAHKDLLHYCSEGPEPLNSYSGTIRTGSGGAAWIDLPDYFEEINRDFRYQLTVVDGSDDFVLVKVTKEIQDNRFQIRTSKPGVKVSWLVTGVRNDLFVRANGCPVEVAKPLAHQGRYRHPELYGLGPDRGINMAREQMGIPPASARFGNPVKK